MLKFHSITNKLKWEEFLQNYHDLKTFLQSWNFGNAIKESGYSIWRFGVYGKRGIIGIIFLYKICAKRSSFLYVPHGPLVNEEQLITHSKESIIKSILLKIIKLGQKEKVDFIRINSLLLNTASNINLFKKLGFQQAPLFVFTENFWIVDISKNEKELLKNMRKVHRYSIRKSIKEGVTVTASNKLEALDDFYKIYLETARRHHFTPYTYSSLKNEFNAFRYNDEVLLFFAHYQNTLLATAFIIFHQDIAYYHHGASIPITNKIPASYLLHWEVIKEAKKRGCKLYNMWGIAPKASSHHPWYGLTFFKTGFGGSYYECLPTQDYPLSKKYWLNYFIEKIRKYRRGY